MPITLYRFPLSGHCHRVELFLRLLDLPYETIEVDLLRGEQKSPAFLALNPFGQVPVIVDEGAVIADANAILTYLALRHAGDASTAWLPRDPLGMAQVQRWLSAAAGPLAFGASVARAIHLFKRPQDPSDAQARAHALLQTMERTLQATPFLAGTAAPTIADIALYSYTAHAPEGGIPLADYPAVRAWLGRIEALPRFLPLVSSPLPQPVA